MRRAIFLTPASHLNSDKGPTRELALGWFSGNRSNGKQSMSPIEQRWSVLVMGGHSLHTDVECPSVAAINKSGPPLLVLRVC